MKKAKTRFALLLAACLAVAMLAGCGEKPPASQSPVSSGGEIVPEGPLTLSMLFETNAGTRYINGDSIEDNVITRFIKEKIDVDFDLSWQVDPGNYSTQLDLAIAGDVGLPDLFLVDKSQMYTLASAGRIVDMAPYFEEYASDGLREIYGFNDNEGLESATLLGGTYALPLPNDIGDGASMVFIRKDWLDKLNMAVPETLDDLLNVAQAFVDNDMSGNGNTIGISLANDLGFTFDVVCNAFGAYPDIWIEGNDGSLIYGGIQPEMRDALLKLQEMYSKGLIHKEFAAQDTTRLAQYVAQGRLGIFIGPFWYNNNYIISNFNADPDSEWIAVNNLALDNNSQVRSRAWTTTYRWLAVNADCAHPEAAVQLLNLWYEIWQGEYSDWFWELQMSDDYYNIDLKKYSPVFFDPPLKNVQLGVQLREAYESGDTSKLNAEGLYQYSMMTKDVGSAINRSAMLTWYGSFELLEKTYQSFVFTQYRGPEDVMFSALTKTLRSQEHRAFTDIIMGADISVFDQMVKDWYAGGGQTLTDQVNAWAVSR